MFFAGGLRAGRVADRAGCGEDRGAGAVGLPARESGVRIGEGMKPRIVFTALSIGLALLTAAAPVTATPARLASINLCGDQLLLLLAERRQIASLSYLAADPAVSALAGEVGDIPLNSGRAEEIVALQPDLVLSGTYQQRTTNGLLRRLGLAVLELPPADSLAQALAQIRAVATAVGVAEKGEALVHALERRIAAARPSPGDRPGDRLTGQPGALLLQPNLYASGPDSLAGDLLDQAGYRNLAAERAVGHGAFVTLEDILLARPEILVLETAVGEGASLARHRLDHAALRGSAHRRVALEGRLLTCPGPGLAEAVELLAEARR